MIARKYVISGIVQGVGFRYFAQRSAARHQVTGYVRNLDDGTVEAFAQGSERQVTAFQDDIATGPRFSRVEGMEEMVEEPDLGYSAFRIER